MRIDPAPSAWTERIRAWAAARNQPRADRFRSQVGLPLERPIIMTGHQPDLWHPGVLAKFIACDAAARASGAAPAWIVPDQDEVDPFALRIPVADAHDRLHARTLRLADQPPTGFPACAAPAARIGAPDPDGAPLESVRSGVERIARALGSHETVPSAAHQAQAALVDLLADLVPPAPTLFASDLARTDLFCELVDRMAADPFAVTRAYNDAADAHPQAGVSRLIANQASNRFELPLWRVRPGEPRRRVYAHDLDQRDHLAPRALCMTALLRLGACDLFIHGAGGAAYDAVTDAWIRMWLRETLAPVAMVTATLRLPLRAEIPTPEAAARARWRAHHARHDPAMLGDDARAAHKRSLVERIGAQRAAGADPAADYHQLQELLRDYREAHRPKLDALAREADLAAARLAERDIVAERTWAFPLYDIGALIALRDEIAASFQAVGVNEQIAR